MLINNKTTILIFALVYLAMVANTFSFAAGNIRMEDFLWFVVNPAAGLSKFNPEYVNYYPWLKLSRFRIPLGYPILVILALLSWFLFWK